MAPRTKKTEQAKSLSEEQLAKIQRNESAALEGLLEADEDSLPKEYRDAINAELKKRAEAEKQMATLGEAAKKAEVAVIEKSIEASKEKQPDSFHVRTLSAGTRTADGFITDVAAGSIFDAKEKAQLLSEGFKLEDVKIKVVRNEMGVPITEVVKP